MTKPDFLPLYVKLSHADKQALERLAADCGAAEKRPVSMSEVVRQLVRDAAKRAAPVRLSKS